MRHPRLRWAIRTSNQCHFFNGMFWGAIGTFILLLFLTILFSILGKYKIF